MPAVTFTGAAQDSRARSESMSGCKTGQGAHAGLLSISSYSEDHATLRRILEAQPWNLSAAVSYHEAIAYLAKNPVAAVMCECALEDGTWKDVLKHCSTCGEPPLLIVTSRLADDYLWAEVLNLGGYDVLAKPFRAAEVLHVLASAWVQRVNPVARAGTAACV
jgi:DNA-binding response OmpR family regulator